LLIALANHASGKGIFGAIRLEDHAVAGSLAGFF